jgi:hypothetical protein
MEDGSQQELDLPDQAIDFEDVNVEPVRTGGCW